MISQSSEIVSILAPTIRLAHVPGAQGDNNLLGRNGVKPLGDDSLPGVLISYFYLEKWVAWQNRYRYRDWVMDSGAFSAFNSGASISLQEYINYSKKLIGTDKTLTEIYSLDVIGSWKDSLLNVEEMHHQDVPAIPCFHYGEPWGLLKDLVSRYPKIAIGGCVGKRDKNRFAGQCFSRVWPKKLHGFGFGSEESLMLFPWHSVDATNWEVGPCKFGNWRIFSGQRVSVRGGSQNLAAEIEYYLELERRARVKWKKEMILLEELAPTTPLGSRRKL